MSLYCELIEIRVKGAVRLERSFTSVVMALVTKMQELSVMICEWYIKHGDSVSSGYFYTEKRVENTTRSGVGLEVEVFG